VVRHAYIITLCMFQVFIILLFQIQIYNAKLNGINNNYNTLHILKYLSHMR